MTSTFTDRLNEAAAEVEKARDALYEASDQLTTAQRRRDDAKARLDAKRREVVKLFAEAIGDPYENDDLKSLLARLKPRGLDPQNHVTDAARYFSPPGPLNVGDIGGGPRINLNWTYSADPTAFERYVVDRGIVRSDNPHDDLAIRAASMTAGERAQQTHDARKAAAQRGCDPDA